MEKLRKLLIQCVEWAKLYDAASQQEYGKAINEFKEWIDRVATINELTRDGWGILNFTWNWIPITAHPMIF